MFPVRCAPLVRGLVVVAAARCRWVWIGRCGCRFVAGLSMWIGGRRLVALVMWWPVWCHHRRGWVWIGGRCRCAWYGSTGAAALSMWVGGRCSLSDVRRWFVAVMWSPLVGGDKRARLGCRGCHRRGSLPGAGVEISTVAAALTVCQRSPWVWFGVGRFWEKNFKKNTL